MEESQESKTNHVIETASIVGKCICRECDQPVWIMEMPILGGPEKGKLHRWNKGCLCDENLLAEEVLEIEKNIKRKKLIKEYNNKNLTSVNLKSCLFRHYHTMTKSQYDAKHICKMIAEQYESDKASQVLLYGTRGVGKTHLAYATMGVLMKRGFTTIFVETPLFLEKWKEIFAGKSNETEAEFLDAIAHCDVLVLDDFGAEDWTTLYRNLLLKIMEMRKEKSIWYTTRLLPNQLKDRYGLEFMRTLEIIEIQGKDYPKWQKQQYWKQQ